MSPKTAEARQRLVKQFAQARHHIDDVVVAWAGMQPMFGGSSYSSWNMLFTRSRAMALIGSQVEVWATWSGGPSKLLFTADIGECRFESIDKTGYDIYRLGRKALWTEPDDRDRVLGWSPSATR